MESIGLDLLLQGAKGEKKKPNSTIPLDNSWTDFLRDLEVNEDF